MGKYDLSLEEIDRILKSTKRQQKAEIRWPEQYKDEIRVAVEHDAEVVYFGGQGFRITYRADQFNLKPLRGYAPCGWFSRGWIKEDDDPGSL